MKKIFRLISGKRFEIEFDWGLEQLQNVLIQQELGASASFFERQFEDSLNVTYYHNSKMNITGNDLKEGSIAVLSMSGIMMTNDGMCHKGMNSLDHQLRELYAKKKVAGIILKVDSGGGLSTAGDVLFNAIKDKNKPVVIYTTMMASAALKGTLAADEIIAANASTIIGSIGTMYSISKKSLEEAKEDDASLYSKKSPNKNKAIRALLQGDDAPLIEMATRNDELFMAQVSKYRSLKGSEKTIENTLSGEVFDAVTAKRRGLIDGIGSFDYALKRLASNFLYN